MQKWEYCAITHIGSNDRGLITTLDSSTLEAFTTSGVRFTELGNFGEVAQTVAELGMEGWELAGCGNTSEHSHTLYFKRLRP